MKTSKNEFLSALLDGEAGEFERRRLLDELNQDEALGQTLTRYALAGEVMKSKPRAVITDSRDFLAGIHEKLDDEPVYNETVVQFAGKQQSQTANPGWQRRFAGYGMAAALALATLAGVLLIQNQDASGPERFAESTSTGVELNPDQGVIASFSDEEATMEPEVKLGSVSSDVNADLQTVASNTYLDQQTRDVLKQYITLHMQHRSTSGIASSLQAVSYSR